MPEYQVDLRERHECRDGAHLQHEPGSRLIERLGGRPGVGPHQAPCTEFGTTEVAGHDADAVVQVTPQQHFQHRPPGRAAGFTVIREAQHLTETPGRAVVIGIGMRGPGTGEQFLAVRLAVHGSGPGDEARTLHHFRVLGELCDGQVIHPSIKTPDRQCMRREWSVIAFEFERRIMALQLYNTLSRTKEDFEPVTPGHVGIYYCGPTVYSEPHLGHARAPVLFDVLRRWLRQQGMHVRLVSNITDVGHLVDDADDGEDKLLRRAALEKLEPMEVADKYFWAYQAAMDELGVERPDITPRATGHITEQIELIQELLARGIAYEADGSVYFDVGSWAEYGLLSGRDAEEQEAGARVAVRSDKRDGRDFALWKKAEGGHIMQWPSPWGRGYPGWHIECTAMSVKYLGDEFDIHGGGLDLVFPHHEAELAQAHGAGLKFARYWMHFNMITLEGEKMSKSRSHFVTLEDLFARYPAMVIRFYLLRAHYRSVVDFSDEGLEAAQAGLRRLQDAYRELSSRVAGPDRSARHAEIDGFRERFAEAMNDDLNTPQALAALFDAVREINRKVADGSATDDYLLAAHALFADTFADVLGLSGSAVAVGGGDQPAMLAGVLDLLLEQRKQARLNRDFESSDRIRDRLKELGILIEDSAEGSRWKLD